VSEIDRLWELVCIGDRVGTGDWMGRVERPIRAALRPYARAVDTEAITQETLLRMWGFAQDDGFELTGENASLRYAIRVAQGLARNDARKRGRAVLLPPEDMPEIAVQPDEPLSPAFVKAVAECWELVTGKPRMAIAARMSWGAARPDRETAEALSMTTNTFLQNVVRARRQLAGCLAGKGIDLKELVP
jgi:DNA-directed RNA polymerase specialized sigma24 family protein